MARFEAALFAGDGLLVVGEQVRLLLHVEVADLAQRGVFGPPACGRRRARLRADHRRPLRRRCRLCRRPGFTGLPATIMSRGGLGADRRGRRWCRRRRAAGPASLPAEADRRIPGRRGSRSPAPLPGRRPGRCRGCAAITSWSLLSYSLITSGRGSLGGRLAEFADVGAGGEGARAFADHHQGFGLVVFQALAQAVDQLLRARLRPRALTGG